MVVADYTNLILRHVQTSKACCRLVVIYNRIADLQQNRRFTTTMNPDPLLVNFVVAVAYHFYLALPAALTQPGGHLLAGPCTLTTCI